MECGKIKRANMFLRVVKSLIIEKGEEAQSIKKRIDNANEPKIIESILSKI